MQSLGCLEGLSEKFIFLMEHDGTVKKIFHDIRILHAKAEGILMRRVINSNLVYS